MKWAERLSRESGERMKETEPKREKDRRSKKMKRVKKSTTRNVIVLN